MLKLLILRDRLRAFYGKYSSVLMALLRFFLSFSAMLIMNRGLGYMKTLRSPLIPLVLALISSVCPYGGICWILAMFMLAHIFAVSLELALITAAFLLVIALLYYGFQPGDSFLLIVTPMLFALKVPYLVPILAGLGGALVSVVPVSCGIVIYYILQYVRSNAAPLTNGDALDITHRYVQMLNGILLSRTMLLYIIAFAVCLIVVRLVRSLPVNDAWPFAVIAGLLSMLIVFFAGSLLYSVSLDMVSLIGGCVLSGAAAAVYQFFVFSVDYSRTEYTQFEDDEYYYYVKAVPKITVTAPEPRVQRINTVRRPKHTREAEAKR